MPARQHEFNIFSLCPRQMSFSFWYVGPTLLKSQCNGGMVAWSYGGIKPSTGMPACQHGFKSFSRTRPLDECHQLHLELVQFGKFVTPNTIWICRITASCHDGKFHPKGLLKCAVRLSQACTIVGDGRDGANRYAAVPCSYANHASLRGDSQRA